MEEVALIDDGEGAGGAVAAMADSDDEAHSDVDAAVEARPAGSRARTAFEAEAAALDHRLLQGDRVGGEWAVAEADADTVGDAEALARMRKCLWGAEGMLANRGYLPHESGYLPPEVSLVPSTAFGSPLSTHRSCRHCPAVVCFKRMIMTPAVRVSLYSVVLTPP